MDRKKVTSLLLQCVFGIVPGEETAPKKEKESKSRRDSIISRIIPPDTTIYIILPYFNFCKSPRRRQLFVEFVERYASLAGATLVIVEARLPGDQYDLPGQFKDVIYHYGFEVPHQLWIKENLINLAIARLPGSWQYVAWVDADLTFLNPDWVAQTKAALDTDYDILQPWHTAIHMGPDGEAMKIEKSFGYMHLKNGHEWNRTHKYGFWHPGFAWAIHRKFYDRIGGLIDFAILGSGDHSMSLAFVKKSASSYHNGVTDNYKKAVAAFEKRCGDVRLGFIPGTILHHWHGRLEDRKYVERWEILVKNKYDPETSVTCTSHGVLKFTEEGAAALEAPIKEYFAGRKEDNTTV